MITTRKLKANLVTREGRTLRIGTEVAVTDEFSTAWNNARFRVVLVGDARYHVREEDLASATNMKRRRPSTARARTVLWPRRAVRTRLFARIATAPTAF